METVAQPPTEPELHLLTEWSEPGQGRRTRAAAVGSVLAHVGLILVLILVPKEVVEREPEVVRRVTPLIEPLTPLTQKAPNTAKLTHEFNAVDKQPVPRLQVPASPPPAPQAAAPRPAPAPPPPTPKVEAPKQLPEPP
jgi:hypothetical protein